jgi:predicted GIY-YIG superfamily endonuclease
MKGYLYIIQSLKNSRYYVGSSVNVERRLEEFHNKRKVVATRLLVPWKLRFKKEYESIGEARITERKIKMKKSKIIIEKIIYNNKCVIK